LVRLLGKLKTRLRGFFKVSPIFGNGQGASDFNPFVLCDMMDG